MIIPLFFCTKDSFADNKLANWLKELRHEALERGIRETVFDEAFKSFKPISRIIELDRRQPEFTLTFPQYLNRVIPRSRVTKGQEKYRQYKELVDKIGQQYGVQPRFIIAFWGIETSYGKHFGGFSVVHALATLAFDGRRSKFFRSELFHALNILNQGHISHDQMRGSWAGAMGNFQFMPSSFRNFAVDYDGDGKRDIWNSKEDAFASAANYLAKSGWRSDQTWGREVKLPSNFNKSLIHRKERKKIHYWQKLGVRQVNGTSLPTRNLTASLVTAINPKREKIGSTYMVYDNYHVTLKWNRSKFFAIAIGLLSDQIGK